MNVGGAALGLARRGPLAPADIVAGVTVALVLVPQSLAYAQLAGMPPAAGLYAASLPLLVAAFWASSRYLQTGPTALTALLTFGALSGAASQGSETWVAYAAALAVVVGLARVAIGVVRAGSLVYLLSEPVLVGFTRGAAVVIVATQVPIVLGVEGETGEPMGRALNALTSPGAWSGGAVAVAAASAVVVVGARRVNVLIPGVLLASLAAIAFVEVGGEAGPLLGSFDAGLPSISLPTRGYEAMLLPGIVIAIVGFTESAAIARTFAVVDRTPWDPNRDFVGQGLANVTAGLVGSFPVGGSFTRSALSRLAGAKSSLSGAVAALVVLAFLPFSGALSSLPRAALGAFVILAALTLVRPAEVVRLRRLSRVQFGIAALTFAATLVLSPHVERAVVLGVVLSIGVHLWRETRVTTEISADGAVLDIRPSGVIWFANAHGVADAIASAVGRHPDARRVRLHLERFGRVDLTAALTLERLLEDLSASGLEVEVSGLPTPARKILRRVLDSGAHPYSIEPSRQGGAMTDAELPDDGLVGLWPLAEGDGDEVHDASGGGNHGRVLGATWGIHEGRTALRFDGTGASVDVPNAPALELERDLTIAAWIWKERTNDEERWDAIVSKSPGIWDYELLTSMARSDEPAFYGRDTEPNEVYAGEPAPAGRWTHIAVARSGSDVAFFLDGRALARSTQEGMFRRSGGALQFGHDGAARNGGMLGWIAGVALYDRALDAEEVGRLLAATSAAAASRSPSIADRPQPAERGVAGPVADAQRLSRSPTIGSIMPKQIR
jgi:sulfate permease, SulP family